MVRKIIVQQILKPGHFKEAEQLKLSLEQDYELACLFSALQANDEKEIVRSKIRLKEIHGELKMLDIVLSPY